MYSNFELKNKCVNMVEELFKKYENNKYMLNRINTHIINYLPNTLDIELSNFEKRITRNNFLTNEQQIFTQVFLSKNKYFYLPNNNFFYEYNCKNYKIIKEDDIVHKLLTSISKERVLLQWKYKTKLNVLKQIKERNLFNSIPETDTIQNVLNILYPTIFSNKNTAKYFLTILGDNILKKNSQLIFLVNQQMKKLLVELDSITIDTIGISNISFNFMTKYHENHLYENCRLIKINENLTNFIWRDILKIIGLDLLCTAVHYSKRYEDSDQFINTKSDDEFKNYVYYLKNSNPNNIVNEFSSKYIIDSKDNKIEWKNLHFIWKQFLSNLNLPNVIYSNTLKNIVKEKYEYDTETDSFNNITSKYLPIHIDFIKFWENTITATHSDIQLSFINELEIDELYTLFKVWTKKYNINGNISEENIVKILKHFFPNIQIIEDKFVLNVNCNLWDKISDINNSFTFIKKNIKSKQNLSLISFDDAYNYYYKYCNLHSTKLIVSKMYFEKYLNYKIKDYIVYEKFIKTDFFI